MSTLREQLEEISKLNKTSNEKELKIWSVLAVVQAQKLWQQPAYYVGAPEYKEYAKASFKHLLKEVFGKTLPWYSGIQQILKIKGGKSLFLQYGRGNMITYLNSTEEERKAILAKAHSCVSTRPFSSIKNALFSLPKKVTNTSYHQKYEDLKIEYDKAIKDIEKLEEAISILTARKVA